MAEELNFEDVCVTNLAYSSDLKTPGLILIPDCPRKCTSVNGFRLAIIRVKLLRRLFNGQSYFPDCHQSHFKRLCDNKEMGQRGRMAIELHPQLNYPFSGTTQVL